MLRSTPAELNAKVAQLQQIFPTLPLQLLRQLLELTGGDGRHSTILLTSWWHSPHAVADEYLLLCCLCRSVATAAAVLAGRSDAAEAPLRSLVQLHGSHQSSCGYCHSQSPTRSSFGLTALRLRCDDYQAMIDRGWRRSGDYCYHVDNRTSCCPNYAIRLDVRDFTPSKAQRKVERRWQRYINREDEKEATTDASGDQQERKTETEEETKEEKREEPEIITRLRAAVLFAVSELQTSGQLQLPSTLTEVAAANKKEAGSGSFPPSPQLSTNAAFIISAASKASPPAIPPQTAAELLADCMRKKGTECSVAAPAYINFTVAAEEVAAAAAALSATAAVSPSAFSPKAKKSKQTHAVDGSAADKAPVSSSSSSSSTSSSSPPSSSALPPRQLTVTQVPATFDQEAYALYSRYQQAVHGDSADKCKPGQYRRFLCTSPLRSEDAAYGAFHHHYRVDGRLIAVGVVDVLPACLSSVYFFYEPELQHLSLGIWSALQEIRWVQRFSVAHPDCQFYYLGLYVHPCLKMRYKATFQPSQLLCCVRCSWHAAADILPNLDQHNYVVFSDVAPVFRSSQRRQEGGEAGEQQQQRQQQDEKQDDGRSSNDSASGKPKAQPCEVEAQPARPNNYHVDPKTVSEQQQSESVAHSSHCRHCYSPPSAAAVRLNSPRSVLLLLPGVLWCSVALASAVLPRLPLLYNNAIVPFSSLSSRVNPKFRSLLSEYIRLAGEQLSLRLVVQV